MNKNILIVSSHSDINPLFDLWEELNHKGYSFYLLSNDTGLLAKFKERNWFSKKIWLWPNLANPFSVLIFTISLPLQCLMALTYLLYLKTNKKIELIVCFNWPEKLIVTPVAKILQLKIFWLECPDINYAILNRLLKYLYKLNSYQVQIITLTSLTKTRLECIGAKQKNIHLIQPGIKLSHWQHQENIFTKLAQAKQNNLSRKFFTLGTATQLNHKQNIEILFQAIHKSLTVIPNIQLIIIGEGKERKNLAWLAKKMEIDNLVWFVGEQTYLKKWLDNLDIFIFVNKTLGLADLNYALCALLAGLPIIGPNSVGLEDIIQNNKNGILTEMDNSDILAQHIINLEQNRNLRTRLGQQGKTIISQYFSLDRMTEQFIEVIKS